MTWTVTRTTGKHFSVVRSMRSSLGQDRFIIGMQSQQEAEAVATALNALPDDPPAATDLPSTETSV